MASSDPSSSDMDELADNLMNLGGLMKASKKLTEISKEIVAVKEQLESVKNQSERLAVDSSGLRAFGSALRRCIATADTLCDLAKTIGAYSEEFNQCFIKMTESGKLSPEIVKDLEQRLLKMQDLCEKFAERLGRFIEALEEAQNSANAASNEAELLAKKYKEEAEATQSKARWTSAGHWFARIFSLGLVELSSGFQKSVAANDANYKKARQMDALSKSFDTARKELDKCFSVLGDLKDRVKNGPVKLTPELIQIVKGVLNMYTSYRQMQDERAADKAEIARLRAQLAAMK